MLVLDLSSRRIFIRQRCVVGSLPRCAYSQRRGAGPPGINVIGPLAFTL